MNRGNGEGRSPLFFPREQGMMTGTDFKRAGRRT